MKRQNIRWAAVVCIGVLLAAVLVSVQQVLGQGSASGIKTTRPRPGDTLAINGTIRIFFEKAMNRDSVEAAFRVTPAVRGEFTWTDDNLIMTFRPLDTYERSAEYTFTLDTSATTDDGAALAEPLTLTLKTGVLATNPSYMVLGYLGMAALLAAMVAWLVWRYRMQDREEQMIEQLEAEEGAEKAALHGK
jgi:hypothetical protein